MTRFFAGGRSYELEGFDAKNLSEAVKRLSKAGIPDPAREAQRIWAAFFTPDYVNHGEFGDRVQYERFMAKVQTRAARAPLSHVLGKRDFYNHTFKVTPDVLDPRPETEVLVVAALERPWTNALDLGTGSGAIAVSLLAARESAAGMATDISEAALAVARENAAQIGVLGRLELRLGSWFDPVGSNRFDLIVSNPPYIALDEMARLAPEVLHEPPMALTDGADGLSCYRDICARSPSYLAPGGWLMVEIGPTQGLAVEVMMRDAGLTETEIRPDLDGRDRVVMGQMPQ